MDGSLLGRSQEIIQESREIKDFSRFKIAVIGILAIASSLGTGYFFSIVDLFLGTLLAFVFIIIFTLQAFFVGGKWTLALLTLLEAAAVAAPFYRLPNLYYGLLAFVLFTMLYLGSLSGIRRLDNALKIPFFGIAKAVIVSSMTALALFLGSMYMGFGGVGYLSDAQIKDFIGLNVNPVVKMFVPSFTSKTSLERLLADVALGSLNPSDRESLKRLPLSERDKFVSPVVGKLAKDIEGYAGVPISLKSNLSEAIFKAVSSRVSKIESDGKTIIAIVLFVVAWFLVKSTAGLLYYLVVIPTYFIYEILFMVGFVYLQFETRNKEVAVLK
ncbi:MAG: hypothetical protein HYW37_01380 [Candidatus Colwellbacteria bacterium]|nr:hypothetical protein [Candidatus Colwellbacteria bacterium]